jgi:hypothetical protein
MELLTLHVVLKIITDILLLGLDKSSERHYTKFVFGHTVRDGPIELTGEAPTT